MNYEAVQTKTPARTPITTDHWARNTSNLHRTKSFFNNWWVAIFLDLKHLWNPNRFCHVMIRENNWTEQKALATTSDNKIVVTGDAGWQSNCSRITCGTVHRRIPASDKFVFLPCRAYVRLRKVDDGQHEQWSHLIPAIQFLVDFENQQYVSATVMDFTRNDIEGGCVRRYRNSKDLGRHPWHHFKAVSTFWPESAVAQCSDQFFLVDMPSKEGLYLHTAKRHWWPRRINTHNCYNWSCSMHPNDSCVHA